MVKTILVCADDYGMHHEVDYAIVDLAQRGRLCATSVLVDASGLRDRAPWLDGLDIDVGLHLNLTESVGDLEVDDVQTSLKNLILGCYFKKTSTDWLRRSVLRQLDRYEALFGQPPDYVDGHQHVHQLPMVRDVLLQTLQERYPQKLPWLRNTRAVPGLMRTGLRQWFKARVIQSLGARNLERTARASGFVMNRGFVGVYDFTRPSLPYETLMRHWLDCCGAGSLIMTHPSRSMLADDPVGQARRIEYEFLASDAFGQLLAERSFNVARMDQMSSRP